MEVTLMQMLEAREARVARQETLLCQYGLPLLSFTMNIAGPVKNNDLITQSFYLGDRLVRQELQRRKIQWNAREITVQDTGCEAMYVLDMDSAELKAMAVDLEEGTSLGRLLDLDVILPQGQKIQRESPRRCLICGNVAQICARSRAHSVQQLQAKTFEILQEAVDKDDAETAARLACQALLYEVCATPKPGLVDRENSGSHTDMDIFTFEASAVALWPYFYDCTRIGRQTSTLSPAETFACLRRRGKLAEGEMLRVTSGVNTHKGAIFSMGLLCGALGRLQQGLWKNSDVVLDTVAALAQGLTASDFTGRTTAGERLYRDYGVTGVRGQAEAGFPAVRKIGLPIFKQGLSQGLSCNDAGCVALLHMMPFVQDTNLLHRGGPLAQPFVTGAVEKILQQNPFPSMDEIRQLDEVLIDRHLSPGGCADLLALTYMLWLLEQTER